MAKRTSFASKLLISFCIVAVMPCLIWEAAKAEESRAAMVERCKGVEHRIMGELLSQYPEAIAKAILSRKDHSGRIAVGNAVDEVIESKIFKNNNLASTFWYAKYEKSNCLGVTACEGGQCWITKDAADPYLVRKNQAK
jgi:hypothetical protein